ncbi:CBS domain-containing protein [Burkholderia pseudomallei]|uniref:CBS domain-containing protein n=1 Tax=Burkholderia pseudomallei TaxID=28450 RepID=UPI00097716D0|nr:CBS domain-containing protein [Burkholderia pseudomallei]OMT59053.1 CBS domain-containing protein [Burkholderia pseudomallei]OMZ20418.1 CBS domain-containing protein [Burkholderia pseudomallei]OMZ37603.1 CBS domain-containing protein [Burkholderia pseudomallei]
MNAAEICTREVVACRRTDTVLDAAHLMRDRHVGDLIVVDDAGHAHAPVGMLTDRDIVLSLIAKDVDPAALFVGEIMSAPAAVVHEHDSLWTIAQRMRLMGVRRMPVVNADGALVGMVSVDDLLASVAALFDEIASISRRQIHFEEKARD